MEEQEKIFNLINKIDDMITGVGISYSKAKNSQWLYYEFLLR